MINAWADQKVALNGRLGGGMLPTIDCALIVPAGLAETAAKSGVNPGHHHDFDAVR